MRGVRKGQETRRKRGPQYRGVIRDLDWPVLQLISDKLGAAGPRWKGPQMETGSGDIFLFSRSRCCCGRAREFGPVTGTACVAADRIGDPVHVSDSTFFPAKMIGVVLGGGSDPMELHMCCKFY